MEKRKVVKRTRWEGLAKSIQNVSIDSVLTHPENPNKHDTRSIEAIKKSIQEFKQLAPLVVWGPKNWVIVGNGRLEAARELGWKTIDIVRADHLSQQQAYAYMIADNKTARLSEFDFQQVAEILKKLDRGGTDLSTTGFADYELEPLLEAEWSPPAVDELPGVGGGLSVAFSAEQAKTVQRAIEATEEKDKAAALTRICEEWMQ